MRRLIKISGKKGSAYVQGSHQSGKTPKIRTDLLHRIVSILRIWKCPFHCTFPKKQKIWCDTHVDKWFACFIGKMTTILRTSDESVIDPKHPAERGSPASSNLEAATLLGHSDNGDSSVTGPPKPKDERTHEHQSQLSVEDLGALTQPELIHMLTEMVFFYEDTFVRYFYKGTTRS